MMGDYHFLAVIISEAQAIAQVAAEGVTSHGVVEGVGGTALLALVGKEVANFIRRTNGKADRRSQHQCATKDDVRAAFDEALEIRVAPLLMDIRDIAKELVIREQLKKEKGTS
jgi:hypothetical protein